MITTLFVSLFLFVVLAFVLRNKGKEDVENNPIVGCFAFVWFIALLGLLAGGVGVIIQLVNGGLRL